MALVALTLNTKIPYKLETERIREEKDPSYRPTIFFLKPPPEGVYAAYLDLCATRAVALATAQLVKECYLGHENLLDKEGNEVPSVPKEVSRLPMDVKYELAKKLEELADPPEVDLFVPASPPG